MTYVAIDLFSGSGSATAPFRHSKEWKVVSVEIEDGLDIRTFEPDLYADFVWASPPCQEYSQTGMNRTWQSKYKASRDLWTHALRVIHKTRPRYWIIENVKGAQQVWGRAPYHYGPFFIWGYFPKIDTKISWFESIKGIRSIESDGRSAKQRAMIPMELSNAIYQSISKGIKKIYVPGSRDFREERENRREMINLYADIRNRASLRQR